jgi:hypothetical protein
LPDGAALVVFRLLLSIKPLELELLSLLCSAVVLHALEQLLTGERLEIDSELKEALLLTVLFGGAVDHALLARNIEKYREGVSR